MQEGTEGRLSAGAHRGKTECRSAQERERTRAHRGKSARTRAQKEEYAQEHEHSEGRVNGWFGRLKMPTNQTHCDSVPSVY